MVGVGAFVVGKVEEMEKEEVVVLVVKMEVEMVDKEARGGGSLGGFSVGGCRKQGRRRREMKEREGVG